MSLARRASEKARRACMSPVGLARWRGPIVGEGVRLPRGSMVGRRCTIGAHRHFAGPPSVSVSGSVKSIDGRRSAPNRAPLPHNHDMTRANMHVPLQEMIGTVFQSTVPGRVRIGHATWTGSRVTLLSGPNIGIYAVVGAGNAVRKAVPPVAIVAGVPGRGIRMRFPTELVAAPLEIA